MRLARAKNAAMRRSCCSTKSAAHLDKDRRAALFAEIIALGAQAWMTGTDHAVFEGLGPKAQFFTAENGDFNPVF